MKICNTLNLAILTSLSYEEPFGFIRLTTFQHAHPILTIVCKLCHIVHRQITISIKYIGIIGIY
jgi:hypothetical protein